MRPKPFRPASAVDQFAVILGAAISGMLDHGATEDDVRKGVEEAFRARRSPEVLAAAHAFYRACNPESPE